MSEKILIRNLTVEQREYILAEIKKFDFITKKNISTPSANGVVFYPEAFKAEVNEFKKNLRKYLNNKDDNALYESKIHPTLKRITEFSFEGIKYNRNLISEEEMRDIHAQVLATTWTALENFCFHTSSSPEYYFYATAKNEYFSAIRKLERYKIRTLGEDELQEECIEAYEDIKDYLEELRTGFSGYLERLSRKPGYTAKKVQSDATIINALLSIEDYDGELNKLSFFKHLRDKTGLNTKQLHAAFDRYKQSKNTWT